MIVSTVDKENEHEGTQKILIKGSTSEVYTELTNIISELLKRGFSEDLVFDIVLEAVVRSHKK